MMDKALLGKLSYVQTGLTVLLAFLQYHLEVAFSLILPQLLTLLHSERPKLYAILAFLSVIGLK